MGLSDQTVSVALRLPPPVTREEEPFCLHICGFCVNKIKLSTFHCQRLVLLAIPVVLSLYSFRWGRQPEHFRSAVESQRAHRLVSAFWYT